MNAEYNRMADFGYKNVLLIVATIGVLGLFTYLQKAPNNGQPFFSYSTLSLDANLPTPSHTFALDQALPKQPQASALADAINFDNNTINGTAFAADGSPLTTNGAVLGASTYNKTFAQQFSIVKIQTISDNSYRALATYAQQISVLYANAHPDDFFNNAAYNKSIPGREDAFIAALKLVAVPDSLTDYQRMLLAYYTLSFQQLHGSTDTSVVNILPQIAPQLQIIQQSLNYSQGISLPDYAK